VRQNVSKVFQLPDADGVDDLTSVDDSETSWSLGVLDSIDPA